MLGAGLAHHLNVPLAASWHTNVHEYLARRSNWSCACCHAANPRLPAARLKTSRFPRLPFSIPTRGCYLLPIPSSANCWSERSAGPAISCRAAWTPSSSTPASAAAILKTRTSAGLCGRLSIEKNIALLAAVQQELGAERVQGLPFPHRRSWRRTKGGCRSGCRAPSSQAC